MKIIHVISHFYPYLGGMELRVKELSERLVKQGHQIEVFTSNIGCPQNKRLKSKKNFKINYLPAKEYFNTPIIKPLYAELMKIPKNAIIHLHVAQAYVPEVVYKVWRKKKIPYIAHIRMDVEPTSFLGKLILNPYKKMFLKKVLRNAKKIIVLNSDYEKLIMEKYKIPKEKIFIIPNATNFKPVKLKSFSNLKQINLLSVGRLSMQKNYFNLIWAISKLPSDLRDKIALNIAGEGVQKRELIELIKKLNLEKNIFLKGRVDGSDLEKLYENSDLFILPSYGEGFSTTLLEAMSKGLPIIATKVIGNRCIIKDEQNGYLCQTDAESIAKAIIKMVENKKNWSKFSKNNLNELKKYSWNKIVKQTEDVYKEVLNENKK